MHTRYATVLTPQMADMAALKETLCGGFQDFVVAVNPAATVVPLADSA